MDWDQGSRYGLICWFVSLASDLPGPSAVIWCDGKKKAETDADCSGHVHGEGWRSGGPQIDIGQGGLREGRKRYVLRDGRSSVDLFCSGYDREWSSTLTCFSAVNIACQRHYGTIGQQGFFRKIKVCGAVEHCVVR